MKNCTECAHANWQRTKSGSLHPSGQGRCGKKIELPQLPQAFYWSSQPYLCGGYINRHEELKDHCSYWQQKP
jgi:hypothetical protein